MLSRVTLLGALALAGTLAMPGAYHGHLVARDLAANADAMATHPLTARWETALETRDILDPSRSQLQTRAAAGLHAHAPASGLQARDPGFFGDLFGGKKRKEKKARKERERQEREAASHSGDQSHSGDPKVVVVNGGEGGGGGGGGAPAEKECTLVMQTAKLCCPPTPATGGVGTVVGTLLPSPNPNCARPEDAQKPGPKPS